MVASMGFSMGGEANQRWNLYLTSLIMILSAGLIVIARTVTRFQTVKVGADDYTILAWSMLCNISILPGYVRVQNLGFSELTIYGCV